MLNELGKGGSTVSDILKEKTGKSFKELMDDGNSLTDVLGIVQQHCDETGMSIADVFSSQEAGKGAATLIQHAHCRLRLTKWTIHQRRTLQRLLMR